MDYLLQLAFGKHSYEIIGEPKWTGSETYDVDAKTPGGALLTWRVAREPLQNLLRERFQLKTHSAKNTVSGYALVSTKAELKVKPVEFGLSTAYVTQGRIYGQSLVMEGVATLLSTASGRPVIDRTRIKGFYDIDIRFAPTGGDSALPDLFTAIREQLGLKLRPEALSLDVIVIDQVERIPTSN